MLIELYQLSVPELAVEGAVVGYIRADDPDEGVNADMAYRVIGGDAEDTFAISTDPTNRFGIITVKKVQIPVGVASCSTAG